MEDLQLLQRRGWKSVSVAHDEPEQFFAQFEALVLYCVWREWAGVVRLSPALAQG